MRVFTVVILTGTLDYDAHFIFFLNMITNISVKQRKTPIKFLLSL